MVIHVRDKNFRTSGKRFVEILSFNNRGSPIKSNFLDNLPIIIIIIKKIRIMPMKDNGWRIWDKNSNYGEVFYERAVGNLDEMECSKSLCSIVSPIYNNSMKILDVGCGAGHYLRSLITRIDPNVDYTGVDATEQYIYLAKKAFPNHHFYNGDIFSLNFNENAFDIVMCNNLLLHLPPPPIHAIKELIRVASRYVIIRTIIGERNYIIKELVRSDGNDDLLMEETISDAELISNDGEIKRYNYYNMYTEVYLKDVIKKYFPDIVIEIKKDEEWIPFDNPICDSNFAVTKIIENKQISGNLILDWRYLIMNKTRDSTPQR